MTLVQFSWQMLHRLDGRTVLEAMIMAINVHNVGGPQRVARGSSERNVRPTGKIFHWMLFLSGAKYRSKLDLNG